MRARQGQDAGVVLGDLALEADLDLVRRSPDQTGQERPQPLGEELIGTNGLRSGTGLDVHRERNEVARERQLHHLGDGVAGLVLSLDRRRPEMGRDHDSVEVEQRRLGARLGVEDVDGRAGDRAVAHRIGEVGLDDDPAARHVDDAQRRLRPGQHVGVDQPDRLGRPGQVESDEVGSFDDLFQ